MEGTRRVSVGIWVQLKYDQTSIRPSGPWTRALAPQGILRFHYSVEGVGARRQLHTAAAFREMDPKVRPPPANTRAARTMLIVFTGCSGLRLQIWLLRLQRYEDDV
ncbi:hypothetical protein NDU88_000292 [Pleurodeles waltl]|uniref:Uncharacterized protein n=1 Tax=Pleurodeles waltl TaxID=8319 RepID=A0AAV7S748_PLEWA|nr:hypothetical protein NDU88_000292 [Pleurodeles waltl]